MKKSRAKESAIERMIRLDAAAAQIADIIEDHLAEQSPEERERNLSALEAITVKLARLQ